MKTIFAAVVLVLLSCVVRAQDNIPPDVNVSPAFATACENNPAAVAQFRHEIAVNTGYSFVVFRSGDGEGSRIQNLRFKYISKFLRIGKGLDKRVIYVRGEPTKGQGRIEFYNEGKLSLVILIKKNGYPCMDCCPGRYKL